MKRSRTRDEMLTRAVVFTTVTGSMLAVPHASEAAQNFSTNNYASQLIADQTDGQEWYTNKATGEVYTKVYEPSAAVAQSDPTRSATTRSDQLKVINVTADAILSQTVSYSTYPESRQKKYTHTGLAMDQKPDWYHPDAPAGTDLIVTTDNGTTASKYGAATIGAPTKISAASTAASGAELRAVDQGQGLAIFTEGVTSPTWTLTSGNLRQKEFTTDASGSTNLTDSSQTTGYHGTEEHGNITVVVQPAAANAKHSQTDYLAAFMYQKDDTTQLAEAIPSYTDIAADLTNVYFQAASGEIDFLNGSVTVQADRLYGDNGTNTVTRKDAHAATGASLAYVGTGKINIGTASAAQKARVVLAGTGAAKFNANDGTSDNTWTDYAGNTVKNATDFIVLNPNGTLAGAQVQFFHVTSDIATGIRTDASNAIRFNGGTIELTDAALTDTQLERAQDALNKEPNSKDLFDKWHDALRTGGKLTSSTPAPSIITYDSTVTTITRDTATTAAFNDTSRWSDGRYTGILTVPNTSLVEGNAQFNLIDYHSYATHHAPTASAYTYLTSSDPSVGDPSGGGASGGDRKSIHASYLDFAAAPGRILIGDARHLTLSDGQDNDLLKVNGAAPSAPIKLTVEGNSVLTLGGTVQSDNTIHADIILNGTSTKTDASYSTNTTPGAILEVKNGKKTVHSVTADSAGIILHHGGSLSVKDLDTTSTSSSGDGKISLKNSARITVKDGGALDASAITLSGSTMDIENGSSVTANTLELDNTSSLNVTSGGAVTGKIAGTGARLSYTEGTLDDAGKRTAPTLQNLRLKDSTITVGSNDKAGDLHLAASSTLTGSEVLLDPVWKDSSLVQLGYNPNDAAEYEKAFRNASTYSDPLDTRTTAVSATEAYTTAANTLDYRLTVGRQSIASLGSDLASMPASDRNAAAMKAFRRSRLDWGTTDGHARNVTAALYLENPVKLTYAPAAAASLRGNHYLHTGAHRTLVGGLTVDGSATSATAMTGHFRFADESLLILNAANVGDTYVFSTEDGIADDKRAKATISADDKARLYVTNITADVPGPGPNDSYSNAQLIRLVDTKTLDVTRAKGWLDTSDMDQIYTYPLFSVIWQRRTKNGDTSSSGDNYKLYAYRERLKNILPDAILRNGVDYIKSDEINKDRSDYAGVRLVRRVFDNYVDPTDQHLKGLLNTSLPLNKAQATEILNLAGNAAETTGATSTAIEQTTILAEQANERFSAISDYNFRSADQKTTPTGAASAFEHPTKDADIWVKYGHQQGKTEGRSTAGNHADYDSKFNTVTLGFDLPQTKTDFRHGIAFSYGSGSATAAHLQDDMKLKGVSYYAGLANKNNNTLFDLGYYETKHELSGNLPHIGDHLEAASKTKIFTLGITNEFVQKKEADAFVPHIGLRYAHVSTPSYMGFYDGGAAFRYVPGTQDVLTLPVGIGYKHSCKQDGTTHHFLADFSFIPVLSGSKAAMETHLIGGGIDTFDNDIVSKNTFRTKLRYLGENEYASYGLEYSYRGSSDASSHYIGAQLNFKF